MDLNLQRHRSKQVKDLKPFENYLIALLQNIRFRKKINHFRQKIQTDIHEIKSSDKTITFADQTTKFY